MKRLAFRSQELGRRIGVPATRIWDWEHGRYKLPDIKTLIRLAIALNVSIDALIGGVDSAYDEVIAAHTGALPPAEVTMPSRHVKRVVRLLEQMTEEGQQLGARNVALLVEKFRRGTQPESAAQPTHTHGATDRRVRGKR